MSNVNTATVGQPAPALSLEQWMAARHGQIANLLLVAAAAFTILPVWQFVRAQQDLDYLVPLAVWGFFEAIVCLFGALYLKLADPADLARDGTRYRLLALGIGGSAGLCTFLLGVWLPLDAWAYAFVPHAVKAGEDATPLLSLWRENWWRIMVCALAVLGGLGLMFASLQLARHVERASAGMRRLLYGYNAVLTGLLLLASLGLLNVMSYVQLPPFTVFEQQIDWTPSQMYTLSDKSINLLKTDIKGSVALYALMSPRVEGGKDVETLYKNCKRYKKDIDFGFYSPDANPTEYAKYRAKYGKLLNGEPFGLIVVYQDENGKEEAGGLRGEELFDERPGPNPNAPSRVVFKGENSLMNLLRKLTETKPVKIVFTKGHGELELQPSRDREDQGRDLSLLKKRLESNRNYEFEEVVLGAEGNTGLKDADIVVVAGPTRGYSDPALQALREYLNPRGTQKKGKMIVLLGKNLREGEMLKTKLEGLLSENGVEISDKRILSPSSEDPRVVWVMPPLGSSNPIARAFTSGQSVRAWAFREPRRLKAAQGAMPTQKVEPILATASDEIAWEEKDLTASPLDLVKQYSKPGLPKESLPKFETTLWTAVAVSETKPSMRAPHDTDHAAVTDQTPRMVVFGDASWLSSEVGLRDRGQGANMFDSCVGWLRGKGDLGNETYAQEKSRPEFSLADKGLTKAGKLSRVIWLPLVLVLLAVLALGGGIWVVRRR